MAHLGLHLLGHVHFELDGKPLTRFESDKARALLVFLASDPGRAHRREALAALLWPEQAEQPAQQNLRKTLHRLRQALGDSESNPASFLLVTPQTVSFNPAANITLDTEIFQALVTATKRHRHRRRETCPFCLDQLCKAVAMYHGDFLSGFSLKDNLPFEEWLTVQRERLHGQVLDALEILADDHERRGDLASAGEMARRQLALEPWDEVAHRQLMRALAGSGQRTAALVQYRVCVQVLARELGAEPEPATEALYRQILDATTEDLRRAFSPSSPLINFPGQRTTFVGRRAELAELSERLQDPNCRLLTLIGPGGCGKTRLSMEIARAIAYSFPDGACFVPLEPLAVGAMILPTLALALGLPLSATRDPLGQMVEFLRPKSILLVLDNFEHLLADKDRGAALAVSDLLQACPGVAVLVTSRQPLHLYGEHAFAISSLPMPPLALAQESTPEALASFDAVQLFVERAQAVQPGFQLDPGNAAAVGETCHRLDGLPLAIELAAVQLRSSSPHDLRDQLRQSIGALMPGPHDLPDRQQTLRKTIDWSYDLLTPHEQALFRRLAVFAGGFSAHTVRAVCGHDRLLPTVSGELLTALVDKSLVRLTVPTGDRGHHGSRYELLETIREYAWTRLEETDEARAMRLQHLAYFTGLAEESEAKLITAERQVWLAQLDLEQHNLQAALVWALQAEPVAALNLATSLGTLWEVRKPLVVGRDLVGQALASAPHAPKPARAKALYWVGRIGLRQGNLRQAHVELAECLQLYRDLGDRRNVAMALSDLGGVSQWRGHFAAAHEYLTESLHLRQGLGEPWWLAQTFTNLGMSAYRRGDYAASEAYYQDALRYFRQSGAEMPLAWPLGGLGTVALARGDYAAARVQMEQSVAIWRQNRFLWALAYRLNDLGLLWWTIRELESAERAHAEALIIAQDIGDRRGLVFALEGLARTAALRDDAGRAARLFGAAAALAEVVDTVLGALEHAAHAEALDHLNGLLDAPTLAAAHDAGAAWAPEKAVAYALGKNAA